MEDSTLAELRLKCEGLEQLNDVARQIISFGNNVPVWVFEGEMGAGKTTLIKTICQEFGVEDTVQSPTYAIVNEYVNDKNDIFYHFDFYRLRDEEEALDIGTEEYLDSGNYCFIEWPSRVEGLLPEKIIKINITVVDFNTRLINLTRYE